MQSGSRPWLSALLNNSALLSKVRRGFCAECGTPLTYEPAASIELAIGALDAPTVASPAIQVHAARRLPHFDPLAALPQRGEPLMQNSSAAWCPTSTRTMTLDEGRVGVQHPGSMDSRIREIEKTGAFRFVAQMEL